MYISLQKKEMENNKSRTKPDSTGIPPVMKARAEAVSGFSFDDIKVHYNSDKPSRLDALAYAQGNQIFLGSGQEKHLSHELGHIIQQKQGRVKPTAAVSGVPVNTDSLLEREADRLLSSNSCVNNGGIKFASAKENTPNIAVQRRIVSYREEDGGLKGAALQLDRLVNWAAQTALTLRNIPALENGYIRQWLETAGAYLENPVNIPNWIYAHYGYAVETLALTYFNQNVRLTHGCSALFQVSHGATRPDIVIIDGAGKEIAWLDITSEGSEGHIEDKAGAGWQTKPYVYEITYPVLKVTQITADGSARDRQRNERAERARRFDERKAKEIFTGIMDDVLDRAGSGGKVALRRLLGSVFETEISHGAVKSLVQIYCEEKKLRVTDILRQLGYSREQMNGRDGALANTLISNLWREQTPV